MKKPNPPLAAAGFGSSVHVESSSKHSEPTPPRARIQVHRRHQPEAAIQRAVFQHLRARGVPGVFAFHPANGGYRKPVEGAIMKGLGVVAGVPDVIAIHEGRCYALELKAENGRATETQLATIAAMEAAGAYTAVAEGLDAALRTLEVWKLLRGRAAT